MSEVTTTVLLHGLATNAQRTWVETGWVDLLRDSGRSVVAFDLLGHGTAPQPTDPVEYDQFEEYALSQIPEEPVDIVGFSLGARTALVLAARYPERFNRIVVAGVGANLFRSDGSSGLLADALEARAGGATKEAVDEEHHNPLVEHFGQLARSSGQHIEALIALLRRPNPPEVTSSTLAAVTQPTLVVLGDRDFAGPADPLMAALPNATLAALRGVDHFSTPKSMGFLDAGLAHLGAG
jgi:pimeloyl-ACP methyl ester carboxylesterase